MHSSADYGNGFRPGCRKQKRLSRCRRKTDDIINGIAKSHIQHAVGLIHHQSIQRIQ
ncbi:Uncharacterised protein [Shigella sonnei]|nr:Uncharacterised protein [Shigella sonnei]